MKKLEDLQRSWEDSWERLRNAFRKYMDSSENSSDHKRFSKGKDPDYNNLRPFELLIDLGIHSRKDWKQWLMKNHPDKNPKSNIDLVKLVNHAIDITYPA